MIIFDLDGTLWNTIYITYQATINITSNMNNINKISKETVKIGMGLSLSENAMNYMPNLEKEKREAVLKQINNETMKLLKEGKPKFYLGMRRTIKKLSQKYPLGIITNNSDEYVKIFLETSNLKQYFKDFIGTSSYNITKDEAIKLMLKRNNQMNGYYVGDTKKDLEASNEANVTFIHARYGIEKNIFTTYNIKKIIFLPLLINKIESKKY